MNRNRTEIGILRIWLPVCITAVLTAAAPAGADSVKLTNGLVYKPVKIVEVADGFIRFIYEKSPIRKTIREVSIITLDADKDFTKGETLLRQGKYSKAVDAYIASRKGVGTRWKKLLIDYRLLSASESAGQIDKAVASWIKIVDAAKATRGTLEMRPRKIPPTRSVAGDRAIALLNALLKDKADKAESKAYVKAIRMMLLDIFERQGRLDEARAVAAQLAGRTATAPTTKNSSSNGGRRIDVPAIGSPNAQLRLALISLKGGLCEQVAVDLSGRLKQFKKDDLPSALMLLGRARLEMGLRATDKDAARKYLLNAGLDLMRVVVFFPSSTEAPHSLLWAGRVNERLGNPFAAKAAYSAVIKKFPDSPAAKKARKAMEGMKKGTGD